MSTKKIGSFSIKNVNKLHGNLKTDKAARNEAIVALRRNLPAFLESHFELTAGGRKNIHSLMRGKTSQSLGNTIADALESGGDIKFTTKKADGPAELKIVTLIRPNWICDISIHWNNPDAGFCI